jgi:DNA-binding PadR family transcriptional regulator
MKTNLILGALKKVGRTTDALLDIFAGGQTYQNLKRRAFYPTFPTGPTGAKISERNKSNFYVLLSQLKKQGFIEKKKRDNKSYWLITALGKRKLEKIRNTLYFPEPVYQKEKDNGLNIVVFDIPEEEKQKRNWLRQVLLNLEFTMFQKSVWMGKTKLPESFLEDLAKLDLADFVHIFRVLKPGTIKIRR